MKTQSAFIIFVIIADLVLLISFFIFAKFDKSENDENSELREKLAENLKDLCDSETCLRFCENLTADQKEDFYKSVINSNIDVKNELFGDPCGEMEVFDFQQWNVTIATSGKVVFVSMRHDADADGSFTFTASEYCFKVERDENVNTIVAENQVKFESTDTEEGSGDHVGEITSNVATVVEEIELTAINVFDNESTIVVTTDTVEMLEEIDKQQQSFEWQLKICKNKPVIESTTEHNDKIVEKPAEVTQLYGELEIIYECVFLTNIGFLTLTFILYAFINELKSTVHGRCALGLLISIILAGLCAFPMPFHVKQFVDFRIINDASLYYRLAKVFRVFAFVWINMMIFDVWWILRNFHSTSGGQFKNYFVAFLISAIVVIIAAPFDVRFTLGALLIAELTAITWFMLAAKIFYEMTGVHMDFGQKRFSELETRFVIYLQIFSLLLVTTLIDCFTLELESKFAWIILAIIELVQSLVIFIVFVVRRKAREVIVRNICCF